MMNITWDGVNRVLHETPVTVGFISAVLYFCHYLLSHPKDKKIEIIKTIAGTIMAMVMGLLFFKLGQYMGISDDGSYLIAAGLGSSGEKGYMFFSKHMENLIKK